MITLKTSVASFSEHGQSKSNEDCYSIDSLDDGTLIAVIADGVGGNNGGEIAAKTAVAAVRAALFKEPMIDFDVLFSNVVDEIRRVGYQDLLTANMATTLSACVILPSRVMRIGHIGDSRIYHLRDNGILQQTKDQTEVAALIEAGILTRTQAKTYPRRTVLRSALSVKGSFETYEKSVEIRIKDRVVLLTDGVYRLLGKQKLRDLSVNSPNELQLAQDIRKTIYGNNDDDATAIVIGIDAISD